MGFQEASDQVCVWLGRFDPPDVGMDFHDSERWEHTVGDSEEAIADLLAPHSFSASFDTDAIAAAARLGITRSTSVRIAYGMTSTEPPGPIWGGTDLTFLGAFAYSTRSGARQIPLRLARRMRRIVSKRSDAKRWESLVDSVLSGVNETIEGKALAPSQVLGPALPPPVDDADAKMRFAPQTTTPIRDYLSELAPDQRQVFMAQFARFLLGEKRFLAEEGFSGTLSYARVLGLRLYKGKPGTNIVHVERDSDAPRSGLEYTRDLSEPFEFPTVDALHFISGIAVFHCGTGTSVADLKPRIAALLEADEVAPDYPFTSVAITFGTRDEAAQNEAAARAAGADEVWYPDDTGPNIYRVLPAR